VVCYVVFNHQIVDVLALDDPARGVGSGFTGRDEEWAFALQEIADNPFGMGFKRPSAVAAGHNGYLKILLEFGIIGGGLIIAAVLSIVVRALVEAAVGFREDGRLRRLASARAGGLVALTFATFFQPQMFNLGDVHGISFMLLLFRPGRGLAGSMRLRRQAMRFWNRPARAPLSSPGDQK
jgi:O-antigen ligase